MVEPVLTKVVLLGDSGVGKTALVTRFCSGQFDDNSPPTLGAMFLTKTVVIDQRGVKLQLWDTGALVGWPAVRRQRRLTDVCALSVCLSVRQRGRSGSGRLWGRALCLWPGRASVPI